MRNPLPRFFLLSLVTFSSFLFANVLGDMKICALRISFQPDDHESTTGNGSFILENNPICDQYTIDPPPHNRSYFVSQLKAVDSYFREVSYGAFGIDLDNSQVFPATENESYQLDHTMNYYNPYNENELQESRLTELLKDGVNQAFLVDSIEFDSYDLIIIFHAGIGQDFSLPFLDPTPEDIPSTYIDPLMINTHLVASDWAIGSNSISHGIILPETQNHLFYDIGETIFQDLEEPCDVQYGLTGTFSLMVGFAAGLPPLWNLETGESGIGIFGLMDQGSNNGRGLIPAPPNPWTRIYAGWESPERAISGSSMSLPARTQNQITSIHIDDNESFLVENRNNWVKQGVSIDSMQYVIWEQTDRYPNFIEILMDSVNIEKDLNGVITSIPNYDLGLPASGLLIWHIDDHMIQLGLNDYTINVNKTHRGIDLEEADGAQDIGYMSVFIFNDPSSGYFGDMWFKGNLEYERANPEYTSESPVFDQYTFPNTNVNNGAKSLVTINNISEPSDTMHFDFHKNNSMIGFPDESAYIRLVEDFNLDGTPDVFGGFDSLWFSIGENIENKEERIFFHPVKSDTLFIQLFSDLNTHIEIFEHFQDSTIQTKYLYDNTNKSFTLVRHTTINEIRFPWYDPILKDWNYEDNRDNWNDHISTITQIGADVSYTLENGSFLNWEHLRFQSISGIDMNLDASLDLVALDDDGYLYAMNSELNALSGFPIHTPLQTPVLLKDITSDNYPEIIAKSKDSTQLYIFSHEGEIMVHYAIGKNDKLVTTNIIDDRHAVITQSNIFLFDQFDLMQNPLKGNEWSYLHGDWGRSRMVFLDYENQIEETDLLIRAYCYPNPVVDDFATLRIESFNASSIKIEIFDIAGHFIERNEITPSHAGNQISEWKWNVTNIEPGIYFANTTIDHSIMKIIKIGVLR